MLQPFLLQFSAAYHPPSQVMLKMFDIQCDSIFDIPESVLLKIENVTPHIRPAVDAPDPTLTVCAAPDIVFCFDGNEMFKRC